MRPGRRFRFLKKLAEGTFAKVYSAEMLTDTSTSVVAVKLLRDKWAHHQEVVQRTRDEARVLGLIVHPNIVRVEGLTSINGRWAVIMEFLDGVDLKHLIHYCRIHRKNMPRRVAFKVGSAVASALNAAYNYPQQDTGPLRLVHRDIKPSNIMLTTEGAIKVLDFGTARANFETREAVTRALAFGSQAYMAPERMLGEMDTPHGDVFSIGVTLYELLMLQPYGRIHLRPETFESNRKERLDVIDLGHVDEELAQQTRAAIELLLAYDAEDRPPATKVVALFEGLAELANDGGLEPFCRDLVAACRDVLAHPVQSDDPLIGRTLPEDSSEFEAQETMEAFAPVVSADVTIDLDADLFWVPPELQPSQDRPRPPDLPPELDPADWEHRPTEIADQDGLYEIDEEVSDEVDSTTLQRDGVPAQGGGFIDPSTMGRRHDVASELDTDPLVDPTLDPEEWDPAGAPTVLARPVSNEPNTKPMIARWNASKANLDEGRTPPTDETANIPVGQSGVVSLPANDLTPLQRARMAVSRTRRTHWGSRESEDTRPDDGASAPWVALLFVVVAGGILGVISVLLLLKPSPPIPNPVSQPVQVPHHQPAVEEPKVGSPGGQVIVAPLGPDVGTLALSLTGNTGESPVDLVTVTSIIGFRHSWDGTDTLELVGLHPGTYKTKIERGGEGPAIRTTVEVVAGKICKYSFDASVDREEWEVSECQ